MNIALACLAWVGAAFVAYTASTGRWLRSRGRSDPQKAKRDAWIRSAMLIILGFVMLASF